MGHTILYDRKFIRTTRGILPMILIGSSNVTDIKYDKRGNPYERRSRQWNHDILGPLAVRDWPESVHLDTIQQLVANEASDHEMYRCGSRWITLHGYEKWFSNGCKRANTLEEYLAANRGICFFACLRVKAEGAAYDELRAYIHTTAELEEWLDKANLRRNTVLHEPGFAGNVSICLEFSSDEPLRSVPVLNEGETQIVVKHGKNSYVEKYEKGRSLSFTQDISKAIVFSSVQDAQEKIGNCWNNIRFVKKPTRPATPYPYMLKVASGMRSGLFIEKRTGRTLNYAWKPETARKFRTVKEAQQYAETILDRFPRSCVASLEVINTKKEDAEPVLVTPREGVA